MHPPRLILLAAAAAAVLPAAAEAKPKADLRVTAVSGLPKAVAEGDVFVVRDTVRNAGARRAGASTVRFYLTTDPAGSLAERRASRSRPRSALEDVLLTGVRDVRALRAGGDSKAPRAGVKVRVPLGTPAGDYQLLACADDRDAVRERREDDNCRAADRRVALAPVGGATLRVEAFSETVPTPDAEGERDGIEVLQAIACVPTQGKVRSFGASVRGLRAHLTEEAGAGAMQAFKAGPDYRSVPRLQQAAAAAAVSGAPGAALAALLRAHQLQPRNASHLVNAAGVAVSIGKPHEAVALLDRAARLDPAQGGPMGISRQAAALTTRGLALVDMGRHSAAERVLSAAQRLEPLLAEASTGLAAAQACQGEDAIPAFRKGRKRVERRPPPVPTKDEDGPSPVDESTGQVSDMRTIPLPAGPDQAPEYHRYIVAFEGSETAALSARAERNDQLRSALGDRATTPAERDRREDLLYWVSQAPQRPDTADLQRRIFEAVDRASEARDELWGSGDAPGRFDGFMEDAAAACQGVDDWEKCYTDHLRSDCMPAARQVHQAVLDHLATAHELARQRQRLVSQRMSGIAAHLGSPEAYELAMLAIEEQEATTLALITQQLFYWTGSLENARNGSGTYYCLGEPAAAQTSDPGMPAAAGPGPCNGDVKDFNLLVPLGPVTIKGSCESIAVEGGTEGWISAFGEVKYDYRAKTITVFGGSKAETGFGPVKGDFKSGVYVRTGMDGIEDVGWRVGPSYTVSAGPGGEFNPSDMVDFSFVPGTST